MIPRDYITEWRSEAPWVQDFQIEQDLVISRALGACEIQSYELDELLGTSCGRCTSGRPGGTCSTWQLLLLTEK